MLDHPLGTIILVVLFSTTVAAVTYKCDNKAVPCGCGYNNVELTPSRIVGGEEAEHYSWSMIVSIQDFSTSQHFCGGSILDDSHILTAAHCVDSETPAGLRISAGIYNLTESYPTIRFVDAIYIHPNWSAFSSERRNDIAVLHLSKPFDFVNDVFVRRTCVPEIQSPANLVEYPANRTRLAIAGWGTTRSGDSDSAPEILQQAEVFLIHHTDPTCNESLYDIEKQFCAGLDKGGKGEFAADSILSLLTTFYSMDFRYLSRYVIRSLGVHLFLTVFL